MDESTQYNDKILSTRAKRRRRNNSCTIIASDTIINADKTPIIPSPSASSSSSIPIVKDIGDILLIMAMILPYCPMCNGQHLQSKCLHHHIPIHRSIVRTTTSFSHRKPKGQGMLFFCIFCMVIAQCMLMIGLPARFQQFVAGLLLAAMAGTSYLALCMTLYACERTHTFGNILLNRTNPLVWKQDPMRFFFEICSWMASVWYSYTTFHSDILSICNGALTGMSLAVFSDVCAAYVHMLEERVNQQKHNALKNVAWIKVGISYLGVGYVITGSWGNLQQFLTKETLSPTTRNSSSSSMIGWKHEIMTDFQLVEELVCTYVLITLVGVSLILASEVLLLFEPTRNAGMILQARIVDARRNWEHHLMRSLLEATTVVATTVVTYQATQDVVMSLQCATLIGIVVILAGEVWKSPFLFMFSNHRVYVLPSDHWIKLIPMCVIMSYFIFQATRVAVNLIIPSESESTFVLCVMIGLIALCLVAWIHMETALKVAKANGDIICMMIVFCIACFVLQGWTGVIFSVFLSWLCASLSHEYWKEISEEVQNDDAGFSSLIVKYFRRRYSYLYKRVKWTFIMIVMLSIVDICSTIYVIVITSRSFHSYTQLSLSQFSAINVVVSTTVSYSTSCLRQEIRPVLLVYSGVYHFRNKWIIFPLHAFIETMVFVAVFFSTFTATSTVFSSVTLASMSGIIVSVGGHWVCSQLNLTVGTQARVQLTETCALVFCIFFVLWASFVCLFSIYHHIHSIEMAFCLASLAGIVFLASSELFLLWEPTREIGHILQSRVTRARENWEMEPLRSFLELFTWLAVIIGSFALYDDLLLALHLGTFSGIVVTLSGEFYRRKRSRFLHWDDEIENIEIRTQMNTERPRVVSVILLFAYIGSGTFQWIFENFRSIEVTIVLASLAGFAFLCVADLLVLYKPTRWAGILLQDRFLRAKDNWYENPVRSFVELGTFLGVIYGNYVVYGDFIVAAQFGTLSGMLVTLIGEQVRSHRRVMPRVGKEPLTHDTNGSEMAQILPLPVMGLLGLVGAIAFNIIYTHRRGIELACLLATTSGVAFTLLGDMFVIWTPTRKVGLILQERVLYVRYNFKMHPTRTWMEFLSCFAAWYISFQWLWPKDLLIAIQVGTSIGILACVCDELAKEHISEFEQKLLQRTTQQGTRTQHNSDFLTLPYEIHFHIAHFLAPEDLLVTRGTCHHLNNMIRAESARYWLHASLKRQFGIAQERTVAATHVAKQVRSLIIDALTNVIPRFFSTREPTNVLSSSVGVSRALKWVYLNANWIRRQNLAPLTSHEVVKTHVTFVPGDVAFEVFRHMPDKSFLSIIVTRDEETMVKKIDVPVAVYTQIQTDPFSFVAAETLLEVDAFSNWHIIFVTFFAMTLIFIGQFASDVLRERLLPPSSPLWRPLPPT